MNYGDDENIIRNSRIRKTSFDNSLKFDNAAYKNFDKFGINDDNHSTSFSKSGQVSNRSTKIDYSSMRLPAQSNEKSRSQFTNQNDDKYFKSTSKGELSDYLERSRINVLDDYPIKKSNSATLKPLANIAEVKYAPANFNSRASLTSKFDYSKKPEKRNYANGKPLGNSSSDEAKTSPKRSSFSAQRANIAKHMNDSSDNEMDISDLQPQLTKSHHFENFNSSSSKKFNGMTSDGALSMVSNSSAQSLLATQQLRQRSVLSGSHCANGSLLGSEELERHYPDRKINIFIGTWNQAEMKAVDCDLADFLLPKNMDFMPDIYVIGTQESCANKPEWTLKTQELLGHHFVLFHQSIYGTLHTLFYMRRHLIWYTSIVEEENITTRIGPSSIKTKGANAVCFILFGSTFLFINSHFKAHEGRSEDRIGDYKKILETLSLPKVLKIKDYDKDGDATSRFDYTFWFGDLNSRLEKNRKTLQPMLDAVVEADADTRVYETLMDCDELKRIIERDLAFKQYQEGKIRFRPSYKYDIGTSTFDTSKKQRLPGYTDRVLYKCKRKNTASCIIYDSAYSIQASDHKPVFAVYQVLLRPGLDGNPLSGGQFDKEIWIQGYQRQINEEPEITRNAETSAICSLM